MKKSLTEARTRFARRLKAIRVPKGYRTARSFATALDIDENRYTRYERGEVEPSLDLLMRICDLLGATPNDLLCDYIGAPSGTHSIGFAEEQPQLAGGEQSSRYVADNRVRTPDASNDNQGRADLIAWQLASALAVVRVAAMPGLDRQAIPSKRLEATSKIYSDLKSNPFPVLAGMASELREGNADLDTQAQIQQLVDDLVSELSGTQRH